MPAFLLILGMLMVAWLTDPSFAAKQHTTCRDAKTGKYVSHAYAKKYPGLTTCEKQ